MEVDQLFGSLPETLKEELLGSFRKIESNFREGRWEPSELNGGKLCEVVYTIVRGYADNAYPARASKPPDFVQSCRSMEKAGSHLPRPIRIQIPRVLMALYEIRNNRGVGHVGGDVDPNHMDAVCVLHMAKWVFAELVRLFHNVTTEEATRFVDSISDREISLLWKVNDVTRVLDNSLSMLEKTLLLLYSSGSGLPEAELVRSIEHSNPSVYRRDILRKGHKQRLLEYDSQTKYVTISPLGSQLIERRTNSFMRKQ